MKKILFAINNLGSGGAEKSLVSLLNELEIYKDKYEIDLFLPQKNGLFYNQVPEYVNMIEIPKEIICMTSSIKNREFWENLNFRGLFYKIRWCIKSVLIKQKEYGFKEQIFWKNWKSYIPKINKKYDVAISYMNGYVNYFVIDKIIADKKILWIHNEYQKFGYSKKFDNKYYCKATEIVTISNPCRQNFLNVFPEFKNKVNVIENISSKYTILKMANEQIDDTDFIWKNDETCILSIGRLVEQKGFDLALDAAYILKNKGVKFHWFIIGKGPLKEILLKKVNKLDLTNNITFLGEKVNPYYYINKSDVFVQSSKFEGKSIVIDEAKLLCKPIVVTNYKTVSASITDQIDGIVVDMTPESLSKGIINIIQNTELRKHLVNNLENNNNDNKDELDKYIRSIEL